MRSLTSFHNPELCQFRGFVYNAVRTSLIAAGHVHVHVHVYMQLKRSEMVHVGAALSVDTVTESTDATTCNSISTDPTLYFNDTAPCPYTPIGTVYVYMSFVFHKKYTCMLVGKIQLSTQGIAS